MADAVINGVNGGVFYNQEITKTAVIHSIKFTSGANTIQSCTDGGTLLANVINFYSTGFEKPMFLTLSGCGSSENNRTFTITTVTTDTITVSEHITSSTGAGNTDTGLVTFLEAEPGKEECGFFNWGIDYKVDLLDSTTFDTSSGGRSYVTSITSWTAKADKYFLSSGNPIDTLLGETVKARFFLNYVAVPTGADPARYYEGNTKLTGISVGTPVDTLINQSISFQGVGTLNLQTKTTGWNAT